MENKNENKNIIDLQQEKEQHERLLNKLDNKLALFSSVGINDTDMGFYLKGYLADKKITTQEFDLFKLKIKGGKYKKSGISFQDIKISGNGEVKVLRTENNVKALLDNMLLEVRYNVITKKINITGADGAETDNLDEYDIAITRMYDVAQKNNFIISKDDIAGYVTSLSRRKAIDEFYETIKDVKWDGKDYIAELFDSLELMEDALEDKQFYKMLLTKWLMQVVASSKLDKFNAAGVLVLYGPQFAGKTTFFKSLLPKNLRHLFGEGMTLNPEKTDSIADNTKFKIVEWGELEATQKYDQEELKKFITREVDTYRSPYARASVDHKRCTVYGASCNNKEFLKDPTGSRRYWVIPIDSTNDKKAMAINTIQLWAQVLALYNDGQENIPEEYAHFGEDYRCYMLTKQEIIKLQEINKGYTRKTVIDSYILSRFDFLGNDQYYMTVTQVFTMLEGVPNLNESNIGTALAKLGINKKRKTINGTKVTMYSMPKPVGKLGDDRDFVSLMKLKKVANEKDKSIVNEYLGDEVEQW